MINLWIPFLGSGIKVLELSDDYSYAKVRLCLRWYNRNYVGTQYGGNLYSMTDPFHMLMLMHRLGKDYWVWDKSATINFVSPGKTKVFAEFTVDDALIETIKQHTANGEKYLPEFKIRVYDEHDKTIATVKKIIYIKKK